MVSGCGGMRPHLAGAVDAAGPPTCHCEEAQPTWQSREGTAVRNGPSSKRQPPPTCHCEEAQPTWQSREGTALRNEPSSKRQPPPTCHCEEAQPTWQSREGTSSSYKVPIKTYQPIASVAAVTAQPLAALPPYGCGVPFTGVERLAGWQVIEWLRRPRNAPKFVIPRSEATWESRGGSCAFADGFPTIRPGTARLPRPLRGLAMTNLIAYFTRRGARENLRVPSSRVIPRSEATWESRGGSCDFAGAFLCSGCVL